MNRRYCRKKHLRGVTLVEVLIVVSILALVSAGIGVAVYQHSIEAKRKIAATDARSIRQAVRTAALTDTLAHCPSYGELQERELVEGGNRGKDPWQRPYSLKCPENRPTKIVVSSANPDRTWGTEDDIVIDGSE